MATPIPLDDQDVLAANLLVNGGIVLALGIAYGLGRSRAAAAARRAARGPGVALLTAPRGRQSASGESAAAAGDVTAVHAVLPAVATIPTWPTQRSGARMDTSPFSA